MAGHRRSHRLGFRVEPKDFKDEHDLLVRTIHALPLTWLFFFNRRHFWRVINPNRPTHDPCSKMSSAWISIGLLSSATTANRPTNRKSSCTNRTPKDANARSTSKPAKLVPAPTANIFHDYQTIENLSNCLPLPNPTPILSCNLRFMIFKFLNLSSVYTFPLALAPQALKNGPGICLL